MLAERIESSPTLQERKQAVIRDELRSAALDLFCERGFDGTTVDDITDRVGVSRRTFFRYFSSKEDVVLAGLDRICLEFGAAIERRPREEKPLLAVRRAVTPLLENHTSANPARSRAMFRIMRETPALRGHHLYKQDRWRQQITTEVAKRLSMDAQQDALPRLIASVFAAILDVALNMWAADERKTVTMAVDEAFASLDGLILLN